MNKILNYFYLKIGIPAVRHGEKYSCLEKN